MENKNKKGLLPLVGFVLLLSIPGCTFIFTSPQEKTDEVSLDYIPENYDYLIIEDTIVEDEPVQQVVFTSGLFLRSSKEIADNNIIDKIPYGTTVNMYNDYGGWAEVDVDKKKGYVTSSHLITPFSFNALNNSWGDEDTKNTINTSRGRLAIANYIHSQNIETGASGWQIFANKGGKGHTVLFPELKNAYDYFPDFAFIIKNNLSNERKLIIYSFDKEETPLLVYSQDIDQDDYIESIDYFKKEYIVSLYNSNVSQSASFKLIGIKFTSKDKNGAADVSYSTNSSKQRVSLGIKIAGPNGIIMRNANSPSAYTFTHEILLKNTENQFHIQGWNYGNSRSGEPGIYTYEIWHNNKQLLKKKLHIIDE